MNDFSLAVCVLFYEKPEQTIECIRSFLPSGVPVYVLNNNSSREAREQLGAFCAAHKQVTIFDAPANLGVGVGRNYLITHTKEEWLLFVDNDITVKTQDWVMRLTNHAATNQDIEVFIPRLFNLHEDRYVSYLFATVEKQKAMMKPAETPLTNTFPGGASFVYRRLFERLGLYDDKIFVGGEDFEFCIRGILSGSPVKAMLIDDIELTHDHRQASKQTDIDAVLARYSISSIAKSYERIREKHGITLDDGWQQWVTDQVGKMVRKEGALERIRSRLTALGAHSVAALWKKRPVPTSCTLFMTDICNLQCAGCSRKMMGVKEFKEMSLATVQRLETLYPSIKGYCVAGLGEPTLCSDFTPVVDHLKQGGKYVGIITNGTNPGPLLALRAAPDYISISLYGYNNDSYAAYCGVPAFEKVAGNFEKLKKAHGNVGFSYIVNKENYLTLEKIIEVCDRLQPAFLNLVNYLVYDIGRQDEIDKIITVIDTDVIRRIDEVCAGRDYVKLKPACVDFGRPGQRCASYNNVINVDGEGNIGGCQRQLQPDAVYGNIFKDRDPFNSAEMVRLRRKVADSEYPHEACRFCFGNWGLTA